MLLLHDIGDAALDFFRQRGAVNGFAELVLDQQIGQTLAARQAADMRGQYAAVACFHGSAPPS
ncbi:MAG: hypothetical protein ACJ8AI_20670 [Rhodopila sp.]